MKRPSRITYPSTSGFWPAGRVPPHSWQWCCHVVGSACPRRLQNIADCGVTQCAPACPNARRPYVITQCKRSVAARLLRHRVLLPLTRTTLARVARERTPLVCGTRPGGTCPSIRCCTRDPGHFVAFGFVPASLHPVISIAVGCIRSSSHPIKDGVSVIDPSRRRPYELLLRIHIALGKTGGERPRPQRCCVTAS